MFETVGYEFLIGAGTVGTVIVSIITHYITKKRYEADVNSVLSSTMREVINITKEEMEFQKSHRMDCESKLELLQGEIAELKAQISQILKSP